MTRPKFTATDVVNNVDVQHLVTKTARSLHRRYKRFVSWEDLAQEQWLWLCSHPDKAMELFDLQPSYLTRRLRTAAERYARREKAAKTGYREEDEQFYSLNRLAELLPDALDDEATSPCMGYAETPQARDELYAEWETAVIDVRRGLGLLSSPLKSILTDVYLDCIEHHTDDVKAALRGLQRVLGGPKPQD